MRILGIDTATSTASVALNENGVIVAEQISEPHGLFGETTNTRPKSNHAETLLPLIESLLREAGCNLGDISGFGISIGPGSFTGLRIGLSTLKGLAYGVSIPIVGVSTLLANAARVTDYHGLVCSFLNARKNEVYTALFRKEDNVLYPITDEAATSAVVALETVASLDGSASCLFLGDGVAAYADLIQAYFGTRAKLTAGECYPSVASAVAHLSIGRMLSGNDDAVGLLVPTYLRAPECEMKARSELQPIEMPGINLR